MVSDAPLRKIIGADALRAITGANLAAPLGGALGIAPLLLGVIEARAQHAHRLGAVAVLRAVILHADDDAGRHMGDADRRFGLVDVLTTRALRAHGFDLEVSVLDVDVDVFDLGQHCNRCGGCWYPPPGLSLTHSLHP